MSADRVFHALADPTRRRILESLADEPASASRLARGMPITRQAVAKHLAGLRAAELVSVERLGREAVYSLEPAPLADAARWIARVGAEWDGRLAALKRVVDGPAGQRSKPS